jgi:hypothetical protein
MSKAKNTVETVREVLAHKIHRFVRIVEGLVGPHDTRAVKERSELLDLHVLELNLHTEFALECDCITSADMNCIRSEADRIWSSANNLLHYGADASPRGQARLNKYASACRDIKWRAQCLQHDHVPQALSPRRRKPLQGRTTA